MISYWSVTIDRVCILVCMLSACVCSQKKWKFHWFTGDSEIRNDIWVSRETRQRQVRFIAVRFLLKRVDCSNIVTVYLIVYLWLIKHTCVRMFCIYSFVVCALEIKWDCVKTVFMPRIKTLSVLKWSIDWMVRTRLWGPTHPLRISKHFPYLCVMHTYVRVCRNEETKGSNIFVNAGYSRCVRS